MATPAEQRVAESSHQTPIGVHGQKRAGKTPMANVRRLVALHVGGIDHDEATGALTEGENVRAIDLVLYQMEQHVHRQDNVGLGAEEAVRSPRDTAAVAH